MNQAFAFNQRAFGQQEQEYDPFTVGIGVAAERAIDTATFGILHPDIIPEQAEINSPIATLIGSIAGSIVGMYPSFGAAAAVTSRVFKTFNYGRRVYDSAVLMKAGNIIGKAEALPQAFMSASSAGATFMLHDTAREIVRQVQEQQPDLMEIGKSAAYGALGGSIFGTFGYAYAEANRATQAISTGVAMSLAEAIVNRAEGADIFDEDYMKHVLPINFLQGVAFGLWNSRGLEQRRLVSQEVAKRQSLGYLEKEGMIAIDENGKISPQIMKRTVDVVREMGFKDPELFKDIPDNLKIVMDKIAEGRLGFPSDIKKARGRIKQIQRNTAMSDDVYRNMLQSVTGKSSSKDMNINELKLVYDTMLEPATKAHAKLLETFTKIHELRPDKAIFAPADRAALLSGYMPYVSQPKAASELKMLANDAIHNYTEGYFRPTWNRYWAEDMMKGVKAPKEKAPFTERIKKKLKGEPTDAELQLSLIIEGKRGTEDLSQRLNKLVGEYRQWTDTALVNINAARIEVGEPELKPREFIRDVYMSHIVDRPKMIAEGTPRKDLPKEAFVPIREWEKTTRGLGQRSLEKQRTADLPYKRDPFSALVNMFRQSNEIVFLREPMKIFDERLDKITDMARNTVQDPNVARDVQYAVQDMRKWADLIIFKKPTETSRKVDRFLTGLLQNNKIGQSIDKLAAQWDMDLGGSPTKAIGGFMSKTFIRTFMGMRPKLAIRNATQWLMAHSFVDNVSMYKALTGQETPLFNELLNKSMFYKQSIGGAEDIKIAQKGAIGQLDQAALGQFESSHIYGVKRSGLAGYWGAVRKILHPTNKYNWADKEGIDLRAKSGKNNFSPREVEYIKQEMDAVMNNTNFLYNIFGLPMIFRSDVARPFTTLMSFPMNYTYKYLSEIGYRAWNGTPSWARDMKNPPKIPLSERLGAVKHFVAMGVTVAALEEILDVDMSSILPFSWSPSRETGIAGSRWQTGIYDLRPSPAVSLFLETTKIFSTDESKRNEGRRNVLKIIPQYKGVPFPFAQAARDWEKALTEGEPKEMFFYKPYRPSQRKRKKNEAFGGFEGFGAFKGFKGF